MIDPVEILKKSIDSLINSISSNFDITYRQIINVLKDKAEELTEQAEEEFKNEK